MKVSSAEFIRNYSALSDKALQEPVTITKDGQARLVLISSEEYQRMCRRDRRVIRVEDMSDEEMDEILNQRVPEEYDYLNEELKDWKP